MKRLVLDLDDTLTAPESGQTVDYRTVACSHDMAGRVREYKALGFEIIIYTARNMQTHNCSVGKINAKTLPIIIDWLNRHDIPFDEIHVGKPWCGKDGFYVDDKAIRPSEFKTLSYDDIRKLISAETGSGQ